MRREEQKVEGSGLSIDHRQLPSDHRWLLAGFEPLNPISAWSVLNPGSVPSPTTMLGASVCQAKAVSAIQGSTPT